MSLLLAQLALGLILSGLIGFVAYRRGSLSRGGVVGAVIIGTAIFGFGGLAWGLVLIVFFVTSSLLSHYKEAAKEKLAEKFDKGQRRDLWQALANGGVGALIAGALYLPAPSSFFVVVGRAHLFLEPHLLLEAAFVGAMATVNADTWATELGVLSRTRPRLITNFETVDIGTSGGVSTQGILAAFAGALVIAIALPVFQFLGCRLQVDLSGNEYFIDPCRPMLMLVPVGALAGLAGTLFDSFLGATAQAIYWCPTCQKETEKTLHTCGTPTEHRRGWRWLNNDAVNFISSMVGAGIAGGLWILIGPFAWEITSGMMFFYTPLIVGVVLLAVLLIQWVNTS